MINNTNSILINEGLGYLQAQNIDNPYLNCQLILMLVTGKSKIFLMTNPEYELNDQEVRCYWALLEKRREGFPLQYIVRNQEFMGMDFYVDPRVLIPRPDTEILVESVLQYNKESAIPSPKILDIGTGSGAIAISLAKYIKDAQVTAVDISVQAIEVAVFNASKNQVGERVRFIKSNLFANVDGTFNIIVSNPPYIPKKDIAELMVEVKDYEPMGALDGGVDGLDFYRIITSKAVDYLEPMGLLAFEVGHDQGRAVKDIIEQSHKYTNIKLVKDLASIDRVVLAQRL